MDRQLEQTRLRLESLIDVGQLLISTVEPDELLKVILKSAMDIFSVEACSLAIIDETERQLIFACSVGGANVKEFRIDLGHGIVGWVAQTGQGVVCNDVSSDPRFFAGVDQKTGFKTKSILCAPLKERSKVIGSIELINTTHPQAFTDEDMKLLSAFGGLAVTAINRAKAFTTTRNSNRVFQEQIQDRYRFILGQNKAMLATLQMARTVAGSKSTVLLLGESGTGKEVMAHSIHRWSPRAEHPFIAVNCVVLTPELMESELFGHEKGSFTGAIAQKKGRFELADGGTIFLDEIGEITPGLQAKLLRVLQEKEFQRVGGTKNIRTDVRIIAATNRDLRQAIKTGAFREDLYYRLNVVSITLPALRDRLEDLPGLVNYFIHHYCQEVKRIPLAIDPSAMKLLQSYTWPGNIRELQNAIERAVVLCSGQTIGEADLPDQICDPFPSSENVSPNSRSSDDMLPMGLAVDHYKRSLIGKALRAADGNQAEAAEALGLQRSNLSRLMKSLGLR